MNSLPVAAHRIPAVSPPISAGRNLTLVFGTNMYMPVKMVATMA